MPIKRTFGWIQNPGDLKKLKKVVSIFQVNSLTHRWLTNERLPLLLKYNLISKENYELFQSELSKNELQLSYSILKGKGSGSNDRKNALCTGIVQTVIDAQSERIYTDSLGISKKMKKP